MSDLDLNTNRQSLAAFVFCFKIHALLLSNSRAAFLDTAFFVHGNCCQLFQSTFPIFFSVKLGIYCCRQADVNNFVSMMGDEQSATLSDEMLAMLGETS